MFWFGLFQVVELRGFVGVHLVLDPVRSGFDPGPILEGPGGESLQAEVRLEANPLREAGLPERLVRVHSSVYFEFFPAIEAG